MFHDADDQRGGYTGRGSGVGSDVNSKVSNKSTEVKLLAAYPGPESIRSSGKCQRYTNDVHQSEGQKPPCSAPGSLYRAANQERSTANSYCTGQVDDRQGERTVR